MTSQDSLPPRELLHLSIEVSTPQGSLALFKGDQLLWSHSWERTASHSELLTASLEKGIAQTGQPLGDLSFVAVTRGPGSFTGLRVGINMAKTLAMSLNLPVVAPTTLDILAQAARPDLPEGSHLLTAMNAFKGMVYWALYQKRQGHWMPLSEPAASTWEDLAPHLTESSYHFLGDGYLPLASSVPEAVRSRLDFSHGQSHHPSALVLGPWAWRAYQKGDHKGWESLHPLYVRRSEAEEKRRSTT